MNCYCSHHMNLNRCIPDCIPEESKVFMAMLTTINQHISLPDDCNKPRDFWLIKVLVCVETITEKKFPMWQQTTLQVQINNLFWALCVEMGSAAHLRSWFLNNPTTESSQNISAGSGPRQIWPRTCLSMRLMIAPAVWGWDRRQFSSVISQVWFSAVWRLWRPFSVLRLNLVRLLTPSVCGLSVFTITF